MRSRGLDIGQAFLSVYGPRWSHKFEKKDEANIQPSWPSKLGQIWIYYMGKECHLLMAHRLGYTLFWEIGQKHPKFLLQFTQNQSEHNFFTIQGWLVQSVINPLTWSFLQKMCFLDILVVFRLDLGQISFNLVQIYFQHDSLPFLPLASRFTTFRLGRAQKSKFWEKVTYVF